MPNFQLLRRGRDGNEMPSIAAECSTSLEPQHRAVCALVCFKRVKVLDEMMTASLLRRDRVCLGMSSPQHWKQTEKSDRAGIVAQSFVRHDGTKIGAANADVDDIADRLSGVALPLPLRTPVGEDGHLVRTRHGPMAQRQTPSNKEYCLRLERAGHNANRSLSP